MVNEQREKILRYYRGTEGELVAQKLVNLTDALAKTHKYRLSGFLDPYGQEIAEMVQANLGGFHLSFDGGYQGAERARAMFIDEDFKGTPSGYEISCVHAAWDERFAHVTHRDVLGAILGLGITREAVGDLLLSQGSARILCTSEMAEFLSANLDKIGAVPVKSEISSLEDIAPREERCKEIRATVASLRLDSITASGFGISRSRAASDIDADKLRLNWQPVKGPSQAVKEGDVLSMRGRGRLVVESIGGQTKKGRTVVVLKRYL